MMDLRGYELRLVRKTCLRYPFQSFTWNPNDPCFVWKGPCFGGLTFKNRGQLGIAWGFLLIDICSHEPNHFNRKKPSGVRWLWVAQVGVSCVWEDDVPNFQRTGGEVVGLVRFLGLLVYRSLSIANAQDFWCFMVNLSYTMVYKWFVMGVEVSCLVFFWSCSRKWKWQCPASLVFHKDVPRQMRNSKAPLDFRWDG